MYLLYLHQYYIVWCTLQVCHVDRFRYPKPMHTFHVSLKVGEREFFGEGETMQAARHCAATMALNVLRSLPLPTMENPVDTETSEADDEMSPGKGNEMWYNELIVCLHKSTM